MASRKLRLGWATLLAPSARNVLAGLDTSLSLSEVKDELCRRLRVRAVEGRPGGHARADYPPRAGA
jgi:hypothetical protein